MTKVRPVLRDDPFAGVGWNTSLALLALKKLQVGETLRGEESESIRNTRMFVGSVLLHYPIFSAEGRRASFFWEKACDVLRRKELEQLEVDLILISRALDCRVNFGTGWPLLERAQEAVCDILEAVNRCRS